ncbi:MAG: GNAT family N-acetyltransferase [Candidatus Sulfotelmatobacter sp.]
MRIVVETEIREDSDLRRAWNDLALRMEHPEVFYTYEWALAVQRAYGDRLKPLVFLAYEGDALVAVVAFASEKTGSSLGFLTSSTGDYCDFLSEPGRRQEFVDAVFAELKNRTTAKIVLTNLPADSSTVAALRCAASSRRYHLRSRTAYVCARVVPGAGEERVSLKHTVGGKKRLRRNMRELEKRGGVSVRHDTQWDQIEPVLQSFHRAHIARFLATGRISNQVRKERRAFLYELAHELSHSGWVTVSRLFVGETAAAWNYGFRFAGSWFWYQPTVNSGYEDFSPGYCLLAKIVQLACDSPDIDLIDLGLGAEDYKERFATAGRQTLYVVLNNSFAGHLREIVRENAAAIAKASPKVENGIRSVISYAGKMRARLGESGVLGLMRWVGRRTLNSLFAYEKVLFFDSPRSDESQMGNSGLTLRQLDSDILGAAAISYEHDPVTLNYLMRSANRFRSEESVGFALVTSEETPVHFCWAKNFEGFEMAELGRKLQAPCANAVMIFDCFTPVSARGHGFFAEAIAALAHRLRSEGKAPWIFGAATNQASLRGIEKSGFTYKFSLGRRKVLGFVKEKDSIGEHGLTNVPGAVPAP